MFLMNLLVVSVSFILLSSTPITSAWDRRIQTSHEEVTEWIKTSEAVEKKEEGDPCNVSPSLAYLRSHLKDIISSPSYRPPYKGYNHEPMLWGKETALRIQAEQPLRYFFYIQKVLEPYRSRLAEANAPSTSFCYMNKHFILWVGEGKDRRGLMLMDTAVCLPNSETTTQGKCVSCNAHLKAELENGTLIKDATTIGHLMATCQPSTRGPNPDPSSWSPEKKTTKERRLKWFLESSFVFEGKKFGDECSASPELSKVRAYVDILMKKHFGSRNHGNVSLTLTIPGMEGEDEKLYEEVKAELMSGKHKEWFEEKLKGLWEWKNTFEEVYCSREDGLICVQGKCRDCGVEAVRKDEDLEEACYPVEEGGRRGGRQEGGGGGGDDDGDGKGGDDDKKEMKGSSGSLNGMQLSEFTVLLGIVCSTILVMLR
jgi:hypothetical protein